MGYIFTALFQIKNTAWNETFEDMLVDSSAFPAVFTLNQMDERQSSPIRRREDRTSIDIDFGSVSFLFNPFNINIGCIRVNRGWTDFLTYTPTTNIAREICLETMKFFASEEAIYLADCFGFDYLFSDYSWSQITQSLERRMGPTAVNIEDIYKEFEEHIETDGYYIEFNQPERID